MTTTNQEAAMPTTITIRDQYLDGNSPDGFNHAKFVKLLSEEYRGIALARYPEARVCIRIDRQSHCSGVRSGAEVEISVDGEPRCADSDISREIETASALLFDRVGSDDDMYE
jgi:hypothetical protein